MDDKTALKLGAVFNASLTPRQRFVSAFASLATTDLIELLPQLHPCLHATARDLVNRAKGIREHAKTVLESPESAS